MIWVAVRSLRSLADPMASQARGYAFASRKNGFKIPLAVVEKPEGRGRKDISDLS